MLESKNNSLKLGFYSFHPCYPADTYSSCLIPLAGTIFTVFPCSHLLHWFLPVAHFVYCWFKSLYLVKMSMKINISDFNLTWRCSRRWNKSLAGWQWCSSSDHSVLFSVMNKLLVVMKRRETDFYVPEVFCCLFWLSWPDPTSHSASWWALAAQTELTAQSHFELKLHGFKVGSLDQTLIQDLGVRW